MINKISKTFATFAVISIFFTVNLFAQKTNESSNVQTPKTAVTSFAPKVIQIDEIKITELLQPKGKPLLVNFWATWCIPCREEFPDLVKLDAEYKGKIDFITISLDDLAEINRDVPKFLNEMKATMPTYLLKTADENEVIGSISKAWGGGLPFTVLYNEKGDIIYTRQGLIQIETVREKLNKLLTTDNQITESLITELPSLHKKYMYEKGLEDAKNDIAKSKYMILRYGFGPGSADSSNTLKDKYNIEIKEYGCIVTPGLIEYIKGYNEISKPEIKRKFNLDF